MAEPEKNFDKLKEEAKNDKDEADIFADLEKESKAWDKVIYVARKMQSLYTDGATRTPRSTAS